MGKSHFDRLRTLIHQAGLDAVTIVPGPNFHYLTGVDFHLMERPTLLFVPVEGKPVMLVPSLEVSKWEEAGIQSHTVPWRDSDGYESALAKAMGVLNLAGKRVGVEGLRMRVLEGQLIEEFTHNSVISAEDVFVDLRIIKTQEEIERHRKAIQISEEALNKTLASLHIGITEIEVAKMLSQFQSDLGGKVDSFSPIALFGPRSALPHGVAGTTQLKQGDTLLLDFGTLYEGYVSDITRVFFIGEPTQHMREIFEAVLAANTAGREAVKPGVTAESVDMATSAIMRDRGFGEYILHRTGHGIGTDIHEHPNINMGNKRELAEGMVFTIEPGLYVEGELGVRIEDNMTVTADGGESLTTYPRELRILDLE